MRADTVTAWATLALAIGTVGLAFFTYRLAAASNETRRTDWRPVLIPAKDSVEFWGGHEIRFHLKNVGRGPALGINGQLRIAGPNGATQPGAPSICEVGDTIEIVFQVNGSHRPGLIRKMEITYYDVGEWWHVTDLTGFPVGAEDGGGFRIASTIFVGELGRQIGTVFDSRGARDRAKHPRGRAEAIYRDWKRRWSRPSVTKRG
jgi:hypothetical protein